MQSGALPSLKIGSDPLAKASGECVPVLGIRAENKLKADQAISFAAGRRLSRFGKFRQLAPVWHYPPIDMAVLEFEFRRVESVQSEELRCRIRGGVPTILQRATGRRWSRTLAPNRRHKHFDIDQADGGACACPSARKPWRAFILADSRPNWLSGQSPRKATRNCRSVPFDS